MEKTTTPNEAKEILKTLVSNNKQLTNDGHKAVTYCLEGPAGCAKTSITEQVAEELRMTFVKINTAQLDSAGDLIGYPIVEVEIQKEGDNPIWISEHVVSSYNTDTYKPTGKNRMSYAKPDWIVGRENEPILLCLDDSRRASPIIMQSIMELVDRQECLSWKLPTGSSIILTNNPSDENYIVSSEDDAMTSRYLTLNVRPSVEDWALHEQNNIPQFCIDFLLKHPEIIEGTEVDKKGNTVKKANIRTWTKFFMSLHGIKDITKNWNLVHLLGQNNIPSEHLILLHQFVDKKLHELPLPKDILESKDIKKTIKSLTKIIGGRQDVKALMTRRLYNYAITNASTLKNKKEVVENYIELIDDENLLSEDLILIIVKKLVKEFDGILDSKRATKLILE